ncbi:VWA domain-containing protein [Coralloluteibacterium stylophorae]|uniref:VWA domain-containing protein n=1 Tax=Coralloluteibacterium stylophorae TaxID=1776034 RepID=A0A8J7VT53_9GAMM|nr:VWA domain-containing protein [Coralloluteibacterium stylophorae]MBS7458387.1 VWA domain-containing protein [Coralloluteibacterium stylophorae]
MTFADAIADIQFLRPHWLWLLLLVPVVPWLWHRRRRAASAWRTAVDPHLLPHLLEAGGARAERGAPVLAALAIAVAAIALAGPSLHRDPQPLYRPQAPLVVALDLSSSMLAADVAPSRIARARYKVSELLASRRGGQVALLAFAGDAFVVAPLTEDAATVRAFVDALAPDVMPADGQRADLAVRRAVELLQNAGFGAGDILLITDSADADAQAAAAAAREAGFRVSALGIGTAHGAPVADRGGFIADAGGGLRMPRLDAGSLRRLAAQGGGRYAGMSGDRGDLEALGVLDPQGEAALARDAAAAASRSDDGIWLVLVLLPLALLGFRRGWLLALGCVMLLPATGPALAQGLDGAFLRADQRARRALDAGDAERARALAQDPALAAAAAYRSGDYATAAETWSGLPGAEADYNRGNALAAAGRYEDALAAYDQALQAEPGHADAAANRKAVADWLAQQPPRQQDGGQDQRDPQDGDEQQSRPGADPQDGQQEPGEGRPQQSPQDPASQDPGGEPGSREPEEHEGEGPQDPQADAEAQRAAEEAARQQMERALQQRQGVGGEAGDRQAAAIDEDTRREREERQALEQWLRRVPDDPGGLLRRKFELEYRRRQQSGENE